MAHKEYGSSRVGSQMVCPLRLRRTLRRLGGGSQLVNEYDGSQSHKIKMNKGTQVKRKMKGKSNRKRSERGEREHMCVTAFEVK